MNKALSRDTLNLIENSTLEDFQNDIYDVLGYMTDDGFPVPDIHDDIVQLEPDNIIKKIRPYYGADKRILPKYRKAAGYLHCIADSARYMKLRMELTKSKK